MSELRIKYRKKGRMTKALGEKYKFVKEQLTELGAEGNYAFSDAGELEDILTSVRGKMAKGGQIPSTNNDRKPEQQIETQQTMAEDTTENISEAEVIETATPETPPTPPPSDGLPPNFNFDYNGMNTQVTGRSYNKIEANEFTGQDIPEPEIANSMDAILSQARGENEESDQSGQGDTQEEPKIDFGNMGMDANMSDKEKEHAAEQLADMCIHGYGMLHELGKHYAKYSDKKLSKLKEEDVDIQEEFSYFGESISFVEYAEIHNTQVDKVLVVSDKFKEEVKPPLTRILKKSGKGLSDGAKLAILVATDAVPKAAQIAQLAQTNKMVLEVLREIRDDKRKSNTSESKTDNSSAAQSPSSIEKNVH